MRTLHLPEKFVYTSSFKVYFIPYIYVFITYSVGIKTESVLSFD